MDPGPLPLLGPAAGLWPSASGGSAAAAAGYLLLAPVHADQAVYEQPDMVSIGGAGRPPDATSIQHTMHCSC